MKALIVPYISLQLLTVMAKFLEGADNVINLRIYYYRVILNVNENSFFSPFLFLFLQNLQRDLFSKNHNHSHYNNPRQRHFHHYRLYAM